ncbi:unnamed protein product [Brachionus calyciflorus]|uniref:Uncharacterized protein n=1 Tax=Brachionus calyciflorus TaxID=104777 RepID=A0A813M4N4_9BILA|nr:unnamed protein product [Brachionus calyciflorus]
MDNDQINFNGYNKISHDLIIRHLNENECPKNLVLLKDLAKIIDETIKFTELKNNGVEKVYYLEKDLAKNPDEKNLEWIYIIRPNVNDLKIVCNHIKEDLMKNIRYLYPYKILFSPRKLFICDLIFEQEGLYEYVSIGELENDLIRIDNDILSMENLNFFTDYFLHGDQTWLNSIAKSLLNIQYWFGSIPKIHLHGSCAKSVYELMKRLNSISDNPVVTKLNDYKIGQLILIDRSVDFITPFCSPLTYEGLLNEYFSLNAGYIDQVPEIVKNKRVKLSNDDKIFENIRGMHISEIFAHLKNFVNELKNVHEKKNELNSVSDMKNFVKSDLKNYNQLSDLVNLHLNLCDVIINQKTHLEVSLYLSVEHNILTNREYRKSYEYIEELINRQFDFNQVLRLVILLSKTNQGLSSNEHTQLTNQILHNYGYDKIFLLRNLQKIGLFEIQDPFLKRDESKANILKIPQQITNRLKNTSYTSISKRLDIIPGDLDHNQLKSTSRLVDPSYAFNGSYRPIICNYISKMLDDNPKSNFEEISKILPGDYEKITENSLSVRNVSNRPADRIVLVYFLGGCTYAEIGILKKIASQKNLRFLFATTSFLKTEQVIDLMKN